MTETIKVSSNEMNTKMPFQYEGIDYAMVTAIRLKNFGANNFRKGNYFKNILPFFVI